MYITRAYLLLFDDEDGDADGRSEEKRDQKTA